MNPLARLWSGLFQSDEGRTLDSLRADLKKAERRLREAWDRAETWERERDELLYGDRLAGRRGGRKDGDQWPFLRNMEDLNRYRALSREAVDGNGYGAGMLDRVVDFVIGDGMQAEVTLRGMRKGAVATGVADNDGDGRPDADPAVEAVQSIIDEFRYINDWGCGEEDREEEGFRRSQRDGEVGVRFFAGGSASNGVPRVRWIEPEQVDAPPSSLLWERWGIRTDPDDVETKLAYYVYAMDNSSGDWVDAGEIVWHKIGTDRTVLRGMPQYWLVAEALSQADKLNSAVAEVSAIQAQIAYVREHAAGVMPGQITDFVGGSGDGLGKRSTPFGDKYRRVGFGENGTVVDMSAGMKFTAGPVTTGVPGFVSALQSRLRQVCARFGFPEFFTGDASNGNYASLLAAGGPAERSFRRRQMKYAAFQSAVYRRACEYAVRAGRLSQSDLAAVDIKVKPGKVSVSNNLEEAQIDQILIQNKVKSVQTAMTERGLDPRVETANLEAFDAKFGMGAMGLGGGGFGGEEQGQEQDGSELFLPTTGESYTDDEYELLTEAQKSLLVKKVVTDKRGRKTTRWVKAGGTMDEAPAGADVQRAQLIEPGKPQRKAPTPKPAKPRKAATKPAAKTAARPTPEPAPEPAPKAAPKTRDQLDYLPKDPKRMTIDQAEQGLADLGYTNVKQVGGTTGSPTDRTVRVATGPDGNEVELRSADVVRLLYGDKALPKASRMNVGDLSRAFQASGGGAILGPARGEPVNKPKAYRVKNPDGPGELTVPTRDILRAIVDAGLAREHYRQDQYELLTEADRTHLVRKIITNRVGRKQVVWIRPTDANRGETQTRQQLADIRSIVAQAVSNPNSLNPEQFAALRSHLETVNRDELRDLLRQVEAKVGGSKAELADRLAEKIREGRTGGVGSALKDAPEFVEPNNFVKGVDTQTASSNNTPVPQQTAGATGGKKMDTTSELPKLVGSEKQVGYATQYRDKGVAEAEQLLARTESQAAKSPEAAAALANDLADLRAGVEWMKTRGVSAAAWLDYGRHAMGGSLARAIGKYLRTGVSSPEFKVHRAFFAVNEKHAGQGGAA